MEKPKSKGIFWILSIVAVIFLVLFSFSVGAGSIPMMILTFILFIATFGAGFTLKKSIVKTIGYNQPLSYIKLEIFLSQAFFIEIRFFIF